MRVTLNGVDTAVSAPPLANLLTVLREEFNVTSVKAGCEAGGCGACTVLVDGRPQRSCLTPVAAVDGKSVTTVEGLGSSDNLSRVQQSFVHHYAAQCGFCTPGMVVSATAYLDGGGSPDREAIQEALRGHMCRCTGYHKIISAVAAAAGDAEFDMATTADEPTAVVIGGGAS